MTRLVLFLAFVATVWAANWMLATFGLWPVGFGLQAPAGVYCAGIAFGLRDALHERGGRRWVLSAIGVGSLLALVVEDFARLPGGLVPMAVASAVAFGVSELVDFVVYERHGWPWLARVAGSNTVGLVVDSWLFLWLAFGSLEHFWGQVVGKALMIVPSVALVWWARRRRS